MATLLTTIQNLINEQQSYAYGLSDKVYNIALDAAELGTRELDSDLFDSKFKLPKVDFTSVPVNHTFLTLPELDLAYDTPEGIELKAPDLDALNNAILQALNAAPLIPDAKYRNYDRYIHGVPDFTATMGPVDFADLEAELKAIGLPDIQPPDKPELVEVEIPPVPDVDVTVPDLDYHASFQGSIPEDIAAQWVDAFNDVYDRNIELINEGVTSFAEKYFPGWQAEASAFTSYVTGLLDGAPTAMTSKVEAQIYARARERNAEQYYRDRDQVLAEAKETSNPVMPLRVANQLARVRQDYARRDTDSVTGLAESRAKLEAEQIRACLAQIVEMKKAFMSSRSQEVQYLSQLITAGVAYANGYADQLKFATDRYLELYKLDIDLMLAEIRNLERMRDSALVELEKYTKELQGEELKEAINGRRLQGYGIEAQIFETIYRASNNKIQAIVALAELRKLPLEKFSLDVRQFEAEAGAATSANGLISGLIEADLAGVKKGIAEMQGWEKYIDGKIKQADYEQRKIDAAERYNVQLLQYYTAQVDIAKLGKTLQRDNIQNAALLNDQNLAQYREKYQNALEVMRSSNAFAIRREELFSQYSAEYQRLTLELQRLIVERDRASANIIVAGTKSFSDTAAAALAGINTLLDLSELIEAA